jgi:predicted aconitase with swiveling domain
MAVSEPLSFWGGVDPSGTVVDVHHPRHGQSVTGRVLAMPSGRGSSSSTAVLAELVRSGQGPAALVLSECDTILVVGALVAAEMYAVSLPIVELSADDLVALRDGVAVHVRGHAASGEAVVQEGGP